MSMLRIVRLAIVAALLSIIGFVPAMADSYPEKPITLIIPLGAGGSHDLNARAFTSVIPTYLGQAIVVKLMPGAAARPARRPRSRRNRTVTRCCSRIITSTSCSSMSKNCPTIRTRTW